MKKKKSSTTKIVFPQLDKYLIIAAVLVSGYFVISFVIQGIQDASSQYHEQKQARFEQSFITCYEQYPQVRSQKLNKMYRDLTTIPQSSWERMTTRVDYSRYRFDYSSVPEEFANCMKNYR